MHLIGPLAAGVAGCESGTFSIVQRGTSTPANYYTDFEGLTAPIVGTNIALDARGGGIFYVNELVTVTCRSSAGSTIRTFVAGDAATAVEVRSSSITGTHYQSGAVAAGNPTTVKAWADMWFASAGAVDFKVLYGGAATNLSTALGALSGQRRYVVTEYGAVGNGVANDQSAINAAAAAANAAGGGTVYFPPGTYRITGAITLFSTVSVVGADPYGTIIRLDHATAQCVSGTGPTLFQNLQFSLAQNHSGNYLNITGGPNGGTVFNNCIFANGAFTVGTWLRDTWVAPSLYGCTMGLWAGDTGMSMTAGSVTFMSGCTVNAETTTSGSFYSGTSVMAVGCRFSATGLTSGTVNMLSVSGEATVLGCSIAFPTNAGVTFTAFSAASPAVVYEAGNVIVNRPASSTKKLYSLGATPATSSYLAARLSAVLNLGTTLSNADPIVVPAAEAATIVLQTNSAAAHSGNVGVNIELATAGSPLDLFFWNDTGSSITYQWGTNCVGTATFAVAANSVRSFRLTLVACPTLQWRIVADSAGSEVAEG